MRRFLSFESEEFYRITRSVYQMVKSEASATDFYTISKARGKEIFDKLDENGDDSVTLAEFIKGAKTNIQIVELLTERTEI